MQTVMPINFSDEWSMMASLDMRMEKRGETIIFCDHFSAALRLSGGAFPLRSGKDWHLEAAFGWSRN